jgi:hypothetical protein
MKTKLLATAAIALLTLAGCKDKAENATFKDDVVSEPSRLELLPEPDAPQEGDTITFEGLVTEVTNGTDGYIANVYLPSGESYNVTVSKTKLKDPKQFKTVEKGNDVSGTGEITVRGGDISDIKAITFEVIR